MLVRRNILFLIASSGHASGGHFHSLDQITNELGQSYNAVIFVLGVESPVLSKNKFYKGYVSNVSPIYLDHFFKNFAKDFGPDVIHCFDTESLNMVCWLPVFWRIPVVLNKCGGPNPVRKKWQLADCIVNFSSENHSWFVNNAFYSKPDLFLVPNRVSQLQIQSVETGPGRIVGAFNFVRIQRIGAYKKTIRDSFNLIQELSARHSVHLFLIGKVQSQEEYEDLKTEVDKRKLPVTFITDHHASKASQLLYLADCVIGTGRGFMEAASLGLPVLAPTSNLRFPILVTEANFTTFFKFNFSERTVISSAEGQEGLEAVERLLLDREFHDAAGMMAMRLFCEHFGPEPITRKYAIVYEHALQSKYSRLKVVVRNLPFILRDMLKRSKRGK